MNHELRKVGIYQGNGSPLVAQSINRNALCSCGSGKKAKKCCGVQTRYSHSKVMPKLAEVDETKRINLGL